MDKVPRLRLRSVAAAVAAERSFNHGTGKRGNGAIDCLLSLCWSPGET